MAPKSSQRRIKRSRSSGSATDTPAGANAAGSGASNSSAPLTTSSQMRRGPDGDLVRECLKLARLSRLLVQLPHLFGDFVTLDLPAELISTDREVAAKVLINMGERATTIINLASTLPGPRSLSTAEEIIAAADADDEQAAHRQEPAARPFDFGHHTGRNTNLGASATPSNNPPSIGTPAKYKNREAQLWRVLVDRGSLREGHAKHMIAARVVTMTIKDTGHTCVVYGHQALIGPNPLCSAIADLVNTHLADKMDADGRKNIEWYCDLAAVIQACALDGYLPGKINRTGETFVFSSPDAPETMLNKMTVLAHKTHQYIRRVCTFMHLLAAETGFTFASNFPMTGKTIDKLVNDSELMRTMGSYLGNGDEDEDAESAARTGVRVL